MVYSFTQDELDQISLAFEQANQLSDFQKGKYRPVYDLIHDILTQEGTVFDGPVDGLEENVWIWISGAGQVNSGEGFSAHYIREYTRTQYEQRYGLSLSDDALNEASNIIARNFINDILLGQTPTIERLGLIDAAPIAGSIFNEVFNENYTPWSGTLLFPFLGIDSYFKDWLLTDQTVNQFKPLAGTYDLISAAAASIPLANNTLDVVINFIDNFGISGIFDATSTANELSSATDQFFEEVYQAAEYEFSITIGDDLLNPGSKSTTYIVGTLFDDTYDLNPLLNKAINGTSGKDIIQAGLGDDFVFAGDGDDLIDGDQGDDTIDAGKGNDLIVGGQGADKIIVDEGEKVIIDGDTQDRLFVRASLFGGQMVEGQDRLIPLLGGVASYINILDENGDSQIDPEMLYDQNQNGNVEYWFSSNFLDTVAIISGEFITIGDDALARYNLDPFAIVYEMNGADLEIFVYENQRVVPPFGGSSEIGANIFHGFQEPKIKLILPDFQEGDFGIVLEGPLEVAREMIDFISTVDAANLTAQNDLVSYLTNDGNLDETLGPQTDNAPNIDPETGSPIITMDEEDDVYVGDETDEVVEGQAGDDDIDGQGGDDKLDGGVGDDTLTGGQGDDNLSGGPGDDTIVGGAGADTISGGSGVDFINYLPSEEAVNIDLQTNQASGGDAQGDMIDGVEGIIGTNFNDTLIGDDQQNIFFGNDGVDTLQGNLGDDILDGGQGADILDGGQGLDLVSYESSSQGVTVDLASQSAAGGNAEGDQITNVEGAIGSNLEDTLTGDGQNNILRGLGGNDLISGGQGDDTIEGGQGADDLNGGLGSDTLDYSRSDAGVNINLGQSTADGGHATGDQITDFENITGSDFNDILTGNNAANIIEGGLGDDRVIVTQGGDTIVGGWGNDTLDFIDATSAITADLSTRTFSGGNAQGLEIVSIESISGSVFDDQITGSDFANHLSGNDGNDMLQGGQGDDVIDGGQGDNDTSIYSGNIADYRITQYLNGAIRIQDVRGDEGDGTDTVTNTEFFSFNDGTVAFNALTIENSSPIAQDDQGPTALEDTPIIISSASLLANDQDFDGDNLTITRVMNAPDGQVELLANGDIQFTPRFFFNGLTHFEYEVSDGISSPSTARVHLEFTPDNNDPVAVDDENIAVYSDIPTLISSQDILANDIDYDGDPLTIVSVETITGGTATITQDGDVLFTPTGNPGEAAAFRYTIEDPEGFSDSAFFQAFMEESSPLDAVDDQFQASTNQPLIITLASLFANDVNEGTQEPIIQELTNEINGTAQFNIAGDIIFTPDPDFAGEASFTYLVDNLSGGQDTATVTINVINNNTVPVAQDDTGIALNEDTPTTILASALLANDSDANNDALTIAQVANALNGTVELLPSGDILFTPDTNYFGPASFTYTIDDGNGGMATANVDLTIEPVNDAPEAQNDIGLVATEDEALLIMASTLLANDSDVDNDALTIAQVANALNGTVELTSSGDILFTPDANYFGPASFTYTIDDGNGGMATANVDLTIEPVNDAPEAQDDTGLIAIEDEALVIAASTLLANDNDVDNDVLTISQVTEATNGTVELTSSGDVLFTPDENYFGPASFIYTVDDGNGGANTATASLIVEPVNDAPENLTISNLTVEENSVGGVLVGTLSVSDVDVGDSATFAIIGGTGAGQFTINGNNLEVANGADLDFETTPSLTLQIQATDTGGLSTTQTFTIDLLDVEENSTIIGTPDSDILNGTDQDDIIIGLGSDDELNGAGGDDLLNGGSGADDINGGAGSDTVDYSSSNAGVSVFLSSFFSNSGFGFGGHASGDQLTSIENIIGSNHADLLSGNSQTNVIEGGQGNDFLIGAGGRDEFVFKEGYGRDTIVDFNANNLETIAIEFEGIENYDDLTPLISTTGFFQLSTRIEFGNGDRLTLLGVQPDQLSADNFEFL